MNKYQIIFLVFLITLMSACASKHFDMIAEGDVEIVLNKSQDVNFSKVDVHRHAGKSEIEVVVRPINRVRQLTVGGIKILVTNPDGSQQTLVSDKAHIDHHKMASKLQHAHYFIFVPSVLPSGTILNISYEP